MHGEKSGEERCCRILETTREIAAVAGEHVSVIALLVDFVDAVSAERKRAIIEAPRLGIVPVSAAAVALLGRWIDPPVTALRKPHPPTGRIAIRTGLFAAHTGIALFSERRLRDAIAAAPLLDLALRVTSVTTTDIAIVALLVRVHPCIAAGRYREYLARRRAVITRSAVELAEIAPLAGLHDAIAAERDVHRS